MHRCWYPNGFLLAFSYSWEKIKHQNKQITNKASCMKEKLVATSPQNNTRLSIGGFC
jgi:hypothetical protein